jgi:hypothetical protein
VRVRVRVRVRWRCVRVCHAESIETYDVLVCCVASTVQRDERPLQLLLRATHDRSAAAAAAVALRLCFELFLCRHASTECKQSTTHGRAKVVGAEERTHAVATVAAAVVSELVRVWVWSLVPATAAVLLFVVPPTTAATSASFASTSSAVATPAAAVP